MKVLISGAGIAGPALAYWLARYGIHTTIVEKAPQLRTGGYVIDFWGAGFEIAERMGLLPEIRRKGYMVEEVRIVDRNGRRIAGFAAKVFARVTHDRYLSIPRGDLAAAIFGGLGNNVEVLFGNSISHLEQTDSSVVVSFDDGDKRTFDLVLGADGLHSRVRELVFGDEPQFERYLGYKVAAFETEGYRPRDELVYIMYTEVGQQVARFSMRNDRTLILFTFADPTADGPDDIRDQKALLRSRFRYSGWECPRILDALDVADDLYFDRVSQIRIGGHSNSWSRGRVSLVGDAASCVSLLAGQGSALAMVAAYILAGELHRTPGDYTAAFARYESLFRPFVQQKQNAALRLAGTFAPKSKTSLFLRNQIMNLLRVPLIAELAFGRDLIDRLDLPVYA